jgi:hypothetical protein
MIACPIGHRIGEQTTPQRASNDDWNGALPARRAYTVTPFGGE